MKSLRITILLTGIGLFATTQALADGPCSVQALAGQWVFATDVGRQALGDPFPPGKDITAIGVFRVFKDGSVSGQFDATVQDSFFLPANTFTGSMTVNPDCTGTVVFITSAGTSRMDSIVVVNRSEILGMSQDPLNLWNYQVRRISSNLANDDDDSDSD